MASFLLRPNPGASEARVVNAVPDRPSSLERALSGLSTNSDFASWKSLGTQGSWESPFLEYDETHIELGTL